MIINKQKINILGSEKGVSLIITFFTMIIILAVVLSISALLYSELKIIKNISSSVASFYIAESGIEKVIYYDRQVIPEGAERGLCSIFSYDPENNPNACIQDSNTSNTNIDHSIYCNSILGGFNSPVAEGDDCDPITCANCSVSFKTNFYDTNDKNYSITATVDELYYLNIKSVGSFGSAGRKIEIFNTLAAP